MSDSKVEQEEMEMLEDSQEQLESGAVEEFSQLAAHRASSDQG